MRTDGRNFDELRTVKIEPEVIRHAEGSVMLQMGDTRVLCTASVEEKVPKWLLGSGKGWVTAEYGMLPRSTHQRINRDRAINSGRSQEISRLIGRSLRAAVNLKAIGEKQIYVDCDVLQADGGTRTAAITGGFVALGLALKFLHEQGELKDFPLKNYVAATSVGWQAGRALLDLNYDEDSTIDTDMNFVLTDENNFIEIQGTAEGTPFSGGDLSQMVSLAKKGCRQLFMLQKEFLGDFLDLKN